MFPFISEAEPDPDHLIGSFKGILNCRLLLRMPFVLVGNSNSFTRLSKSMFDAIISPEYKLGSFSIFHNPLCEICPSKILVSMFRIISFPFKRIEPLG